jgi:hypothetical protein
LDLASNQEESNLVSIAPNTPGFHFNRNRNEKWTCREAWKNKMLSFESYSMEIHPDPNISKFGDKFGIAGNS